MLWSGRRVGDINLAQKVSAGDIAERLGLALSTVYALSRQYRMPQPTNGWYGHPPRDTRWDWAEVERWARRRNIRISEDLPDLKG